jgi:hypothetical protein
MRPDGVRKLVRRASVGTMDALRAVRRVLEGRDTRRGALTASRVRQPRLFYVPFWHVSSQVSGFVAGLEPVFREEEVPIVQESSRDGEDYSTFSAGTRKVRLRVGARAARREIRIQSGLTVSAADLEPLGIPSLSDETQLAITGLSIQRSRLPEGLETLDGRVFEGVMVDPVVPLAAALAMADRNAVRLAGGAGREMEQRWTWHRISGRRAVLVYYPLWVVDFECFGSQYKAVVDGVGGAVVRGRFPGRTADTRIAAALAAVLWAALLPAAAGFLVGFRASSGGACLPFALLILASLAGLTAKALRALESMDSSGGDHTV